MIPEMRAPQAVSASLSSVSDSKLGMEADLSDRAGGLDFSDLFKSSVGQVEALEKQARATTVSLMSGTGADVHQALIAAEKANAAFELALAMRNKAVQCYQSMMSMQF
ncbi:MAG: flagellar hook-basal body complex protein FliE [Acidobacteria bacterium]|nr:flagellar hook-basal body complex protein FliE [Acidobacteriota bacterium]